MKERAQGVEPLTAGAGDGAGVLEYWLRQAIGVLVPVHHRSKCETQISLGTEVGKHPFCLSDALFGKQVPETGSAKVDRRKSDGSR